MKLAFSFLFCLFMFSVGLDAQTFSIIPSANTVAQSYTFELDGKSFPVHITANGNHYITRISEKSGKEYKFYLGRKTEHTLQGQAIFVTGKSIADGGKGLNYRIFKVGPDGFLTVVKLEVKE